MIIGSVGGDPIDLIGNHQLLKDLYYYFASMSISIPALRQEKKTLNLSLTIIFQDIANVLIRIFKVCLKR